MMTGTNGYDLPSSSVLCNANCGHNTSEILLLNRPQEHLVAY